MGPRMTVSGVVVACVRYDCAQCSTGCCFRNQGVATLPAHDAIVATCNLFVARVGLNFMDLCM